LVSEEDLIDIVGDAIKDCCCSAKPPVREVCDKSSKQGKWGFFVKEPFNKSYSALTSKRRFFSEWEIKNLLRENKKSLTLPHAAIISPLAEEWLKEKGIEVIFNNR